MTRAHGELGNDLRVPGVRVVQSQGIIIILIVVFYSGIPIETASIADCPPWPIGILVPDRSAEVKIILSAQSVVDSENVLKVGYLENSQGFIVPGPVVRHIRQRIEVDHGCHYRVDPALRDDTAWKRCAGRRINWLSWGLGEVTGTLQGCRLSVSRDTGCADAESASGIRNAIARVVVGIEEEELLLIGVKLRNRQRNGPPNSSAKGMEPVNRRLGIQTRARGLVPEEIVGIEYIIAPIVISGAVKFLGTSAGGHRDIRSRIASVLSLV